MLIIIFLFNIVSATDYCKLCVNTGHTMCKFKEGPANSCIDYIKISFTPDDKKYILDIHNDIRNHVASGQESRGALGSQPSAADMFVLEWDQELAQIAQRWADQCVSVNATIQHDKCRRTERFEVGQNIVTAITTSKELPELSVFILNWYKQIIHVIPSDIDDFIGIWRGRYSIGQYTQLVWAKTRYIGCASAGFKDSASDEHYSMRFICNYGPTGNVIGESVYQRGEPCSKCPHKVCDRTRSNLCAGIKRSVNMKKQKNIAFKKYADTDTRHPFQLMTTKKPKDNISMFLNNNNFNISDNVSDTNINVINMTVLKNNSFVKNRQSISITFTTRRSVIGTNIFGVTYTTNLKKPNLEYYTKTSNTTSFSTPFLVTNKSTLNLVDSNYNSTSNFTSATKLILSNDSIESYIRKENISNNLTLLNRRDQEHLVTNWSTENYSKVTFNDGLIYNIKLIMDNFFNQTIMNELQKVKISRTEDKTIINSDNDKCEKEVRLSNGIIIVQDCQNYSSQNFSHKGRKFSNNSLRRNSALQTQDSNTILIRNRRFVKVIGIWHNGHCICNEMLRSCSKNSRASQALTKILLFIYFYII